MRDGVGMREAGPGNRPGEARLGGGCGRGNEGTQGGIIWKRGEGVNVGLILWRKLE